MLELIRKNKVGVDIGGSLTKLVYYLEEEEIKIDDDDVEITEAELDATKILIYMKKWDSSKKGVLAMLKFVKGKPKG